jgi:hypothetical protein
MQIFTDGWQRWFSDMFQIWKRTQNYNVYDYVVPADGGSYIAPTGVDTTILEPAGGLLALTVTLPSMPQDRDTYRLSSTQNVATLTVLSNYTIATTATGLTAGICVSWQFRLANTTWYRSA